VRGERGQLSANFIERNELLATLGDSIDKLIPSHRAAFEDVKLREQAGWGPPPFEISRSADERKSRWVDGTPERSFYICALRKLFPGALFVHLVRDAADVVRWLLNFRPYGQRLVANEQAAYEYWLRRANVCLEAEQAYGPEVVARFKYSDLVAHPESLMRSILDFVGEPFSPQCLEPLARRINSSNVAPDFDATDPSTDQSTVTRVQSLSDFLQNSPQQNQPSPELAAKLEAEFNHRVGSHIRQNCKANPAFHRIAKSALQPIIPSPLRKSCPTPTLPK
jgi:hypothetical protein